MSHFPLNGGSSARIPISPIYVHFIEKRGKNLMLRSPKLYSLPPILVMQSKSNMPPVYQSDVMTRGKESRLFLRENETIPF